MRGWEPWSALAESACADSTYRFDCRRLLFMVGGGFGSAFSCIADSGKTHKGILVTKRAKNFFRRGTLMFRFDEPFSVVGSSEGRFQANRKMQAITLGAALSAAKIADGLVTHRRLLS